ncbi:MAG: LysR substrate-binding domain-containing protein [Rhizobiaceae bacterium]
MQAHFRAFERAQFASVENAISTGLPVKFEKACQHPTSALARYGFRQASGFTKRVKLLAWYHYVNFFFMGILRKDVSLLRNLVTFEAASRSENFTRVAEELGITRVAVSRQIAELEAGLGHRLFVRNHRKVSLTEAGKTFASTINPALNAIARGIGDIRNDRAGERLSVTTTSAFATYWLMPRLIDFGAHFPHIEINLVVSDRYLDLESERIDIAIRYALAAPSTGQVTKLLQEKIFPVFSPRYDRKTDMTSPEHLLQERLLHLSGIYRPETRWPYWLQRHGLQIAEENSGTIYNTYINMLQAAIEGQGVGLAGYPLVNKFLDDGTLLTIPGIEPMTRDYYYLIDMTVKNKNAECFCNWIMSQASISSRMQEPAVAIWPRASELPVSVQSLAPGSEI